jgi:ribonucleotide monophosphatase NagD (HAD superfamily)
MNITNGSLMCIPGKQLVFVTNNSTKSRSDYKKKFDKVGIRAEEVSCNASASVCAGAKSRDQS